MHLAASFVFLSAYEQLQLVQLATNSLLVCLLQMRGGRRMHPMVKVGDCGTAYLVLAH
jgi:hypothetical protein